MAKKSFASNFWGEAEKGYEVLLQRLDDGISSLKAFEGFLESKYSAESDYSKRACTRSLSTRFPTDLPFDSSKFRISGSVIAGICVQTRRVSDVHHDFAALVKEDHLAATRELLGNLEILRKQFKKNGSEIQKEKDSLKKQVQKNKEKYQSKIKAKLKVRDVVPDSENEKEVQKHEMKLMDAILYERQAEAAYNESLQDYKIVYDKWVLYFTTAFEEVEKMERTRMERIQKIAISTLQAELKQQEKHKNAIEQIMNEIEKFDVESDMNTLVDQRKTGSVVPDPQDFEAYLSVERE